MKLNHVIEIRLAACGLPWSNKTNPNENIKIVAYMNESYLCSFMFSESFA